MLKKRKFFGRKLLHSYLCRPLKNSRFVFELFVKKARSSKG